MKKCLIAGFVALPVVAAFSAAAADGWINVNGSKAATGDVFSWRNHVVAGDGGTMTVGGIYASPAHTLTFSTSVTLGSLLFSNAEAANASFCSINGGQITFSGERPALYQRIPSVSSLEASRDAQYNRRGSWVAAPIRGTGENTLVKDGGAKLVVCTPLTNFAEIYVKDGGLVATNNGGTAVTAVPLRLSGYLGYQVGHGASGGDWAAQAGQVTAEPGAQISISKVNGSSATLTVGQLAATEHGSLLVRSSRGTSSARSLGSTERLLTTGSVPKSTQGVVAPWMACREVAEPGTPVHFLQYDDVCGFLPFSSALSSFAASTKDDLVRIDAATTVGGEVAAAAVEVKNADALTVSGTLKLGDGTNPGAIALNSAGTGNQTFSGTGTVDFGDKPGYIWRGATGGVLSLATKFSGTCGVTVTSGGTADAGSEGVNADYNVARPIFSLGTASGNGVSSGVSGGVYLSNAEFRFYRDSFGANDVYVDGGNRFGNAVLSYWDYGTGSITNHLHVRGDLVFAVPGSKAGDAWAFEAPVTLTGHAGFYAKNQAFYFTCPIDGTGDLTLSADSDAKQNCHVRFDAANTYAGQTKIAENAQIRLTQNGRFGQGDVSAESGTKVTFYGTTGYALTQAFASDGTTALQSASVDFLGRTAGRELVVTESELGIGDDVSFDKMLIGSMPVTPKTAAAKLTIADGSVLSATFPEVSGKALSIVKTGAGTASFSRPLKGMVNAPLALRVDEGTVKLEPNPLLSAACSFRIDFSDDTTVTADADGIKKVVSKGVVPYVFSYANPNGASMAKPLQRTATINGHSVASVYCPNNTTKWRSQNFGECAISVRTLFIVHRPNADALADRPSLFGDGERSGSAALRVASSGEKKWTCRMGNGDYRADIVYDNGVCGADYVPGETQVLAVRVPAGETANTLFVPEFPQCYGMDGYCGDVAEIIAFDGVLTDAEFDFVNAYLAEKWLGAPHRDVSIAGSSYLPENVDVRLSGDGVLDLNGVSQTVASLTGKGRVVNSSATNATLTVTGAFDGAIKVDSGVDVVCRGPTTYRVYNEGPATNGLAYWLDASKTTTLLRDGSGNVTNWLSRSGSVRSLMNNDSKSVKAGVKVSYPTYDAADALVGGRPSVRFPSSSSGLWSSSAAKIKTIFILHYDDATFTEGGNPRIWGVEGTGSMNRSLFFSNANNSGNGLQINTLNSMAYGQYDDRWRLVDGNGSQLPAAYTGGFVVGARTEQPYVISLRIDESNSLWNESVVSAIGAVPYYIGRPQGVSEVIAYERALSDGEMAVIEDYLARKWITGTGLPVENESVKLSGRLTVQVGADGSVQPIVIEGNLDASAAELYVAGARQSPKAQWQTLVIADEVESGFAALLSDFSRFNIVFRADQSRYVGCRIWPGFCISFH